MCGISGIVSSDVSPWEINRRLDAMNRILEHRGPDDSRTERYATGGRSVGLGFVRLSILDFETGMQPIKCDADDTAILCNGQIYNYIELKKVVADAPFISKGDMEVALHLYRAKGIDFLSYLNGMYAGAILDPGNSRLLLFRDRFGIKPLYYSAGKRSLVFSSEIKPIFAGSDMRPELNARRIATYFTYRYIPGTETLFEGIRRVPPGAYLNYDLATGKYQIHRYWDYRLDRVNPDMSIDAAEDQFYDLFSDAVKIRLRSDVEVGSLISGGIDSSAVSARVADYQPSVPLFSVAFEENQYNELSAVNKFLARHPARFGSAVLSTTLCRKDALERLPQIVKSLEEPISLGTLIPTDMVCEMAAKQVKVVLTGEGADEIFGGYRKFMIEQAAVQFQHSAPEHQQALLQAFPELKRYLVQRKDDPGARYIQNEVLFDPDEVFRLTGCHLPENFYDVDAIPDLAGVEDPVNQFIAYETRFRLPDYVILRLDRLSMRHSLEARTPFLDYRLAEFAATLPVQLKVNTDAIREKFICGRTYAKFDILDRETAYRRKQPFTIPMADWLSAPKTLPDFLKDILWGDVIRRQGIFDPGYVRILARQVSARGVGPETLVSSADQVFAIIIFTLWHEAFFS